MEEITYIDACCFLGRTIRGTDGIPETPEQTLQVMDHCGVHQALVVDTLCASTNPTEGNRRILELTCEHPRLIPAWAGLATHSRELPPPGELVAKMREHGVGALFLFHKQFDMRLEDWVLGDLLAALEEARVPVFVCPDTQREPGLTDATEWPGIVGLCRAFPNLPLVVTESRIYGSQRALYQALAACPNLKVDLTSIWLHHRVEYICREFGAHRLVWSSRLPERNPAIPLVQLNYSDIAPDELGAIAGGNLRQMLSWNENIRFVDNVQFPAAVDRLHDKSRRRQSLRDEQFYDCHGHIGWCSNRHVVHDGPEDIVAEMDKFGIRAGCVFSFAGSMADEVYGNNEAAKMIAAYPDRFVGFTFVNPNRGEARMIAEMERGLELGMQGIKLAPSFQHYPLEGPVIDVACRFADEHGLFMLNHVWGSATQMRRLCTTYPNACFFTGHMTFDYADVARDVDNLYICTCPLLGLLQTERAVEVYGADRMLFGSDLTDLPIGWGLGPILYARIPEGDKRRILGGNLRGLMDKYGVRPQGWGAGDHGG